MPLRQEFYAYFNFSLTHLIPGILLMTWGAILLQFRYKTLLEGYLILESSFMIAIGILCTLIGVVILYGTHHVKYATYSVVFGGVLALTTMALLVASPNAVNLETLERMIRDNIRRSLDRYLEDDGVANMVDSMQQTLKCCGVDDATSWQLTHIDHVPDSCCIHVANGCGQGALIWFNSNGTNIYTAGCTAKVMDRARPLGMLILISSYIILSLYILMYFVTYCLSLRHQKLSSVTEQIEANNRA